MSWVRLIWMPPALNEAGRSTRILLARVALILTQALVPVALVAAGAALAQAQA
eukprot:COSAG01_NODE_53987_length_335_cov_0.868644_1_plen_52_part_01